MIVFPASIGLVGPAGGSSSSDPLYDEYMADSPFVYLRLGEASGTNANNEAGATDGTYDSVSLGNAALYSGGPTSMAMTASNNGDCSWPAASIPTLNALTIAIIYRPSVVSGTHFLVSVDRDSITSRHFQFRVGTTNLEWVKIVGGVQTVNRAHSLTAGVPAMLHVTVDSSGNVKLFKNGAQLGTTGSVTAADYGASVTSDLNVGNRYMQIDAQNGDRYSEFAMFSSALSDARIAAHAAAAGF